MFVHFGLYSVIGREEWVNLNDNALRSPYPTDIKIRNKPDDFVLNDGDAYYLFVHDLAMTADLNVALNSTMILEEVFDFGKKIKSVHWLDNGEKLDFIQENGKVTIKTKPFMYGESYVVRVIEINV